MRTLLITAALFLLPGCILPGDIEALKGSQITYQTKVDAELEKLATGQQGQDETIDKIEDAAKDRDEQIDDVAKDVAARTEAVIQAAEGGLNLAEGTGLAGLVSLLGAVGLNLYRNRTSTERTLLDLQKTGKAA